MVGLRWFFRGCRGCRRIGGTTGGCTLPVAALLACGAVAVHLAVGAVAVGARVAVQVRAVVRRASLLAVVATNFCVVVTHRAERNCVSAIKLESPIRAVTRVCVASGALHQTRTLGTANPVEAAIVFVHVEEGGGVDLPVEGGAIRHLAPVVGGPWL